MAGNILVVHRNELVLDVIQEMLNKTGCRVTMATDGHRALAKAMCERFSLIIVDRNLDGEFTGIDLVERLRKYGIRTPIIGTAPERSWQTPTAAGDVDSFLSSPFGYGELINAAESGVHGDSVLIVPVKGFLNAGNNPPTETDHLGTVSLPLHMNEGGQNAYCLLVTGDTLVPDGVHDGDVLLVDPDQIAEIGSLCVVELDRSLRAGTFISSGRVNVRTRIGAMIEMEVATDELIGTVVWHIRRM